jgi:hypothetical protein
MFTLKVHYYMIDLGAVMLIGAKSNRNHYLHRTPKLLHGFNYKSKGENNGRRRSWGTLLGSQHFGGKRACWSSEMGQMTSDSITHIDLHKLNNKLISA